MIDDRRMMMLTARYYLNQISQLNREIEVKQMDIDDLRDMLYSIGSVANDPNKVQTSTNLHRQEDVIAKLVDLEAEASLLLQDKLDKRQEILRTISKVPDGDCHKLLYLRYVRCMRWVDVAKQMDYSVEHIRNYMDRKAVAMVEEVLRNEELLQ